MKKFLPSKGAVIELAKAVAEQTRLTGQLHGVAAVFQNEDLVVTEIGWAEQSNTVRLCYRSKKGEPNTVLVGSGTPFFAEVTPGHQTVFSGIG
jgi:hypothetical protein